jgi:membrane associated rhomboid family serine protease
MDRLTSLWQPHGFNRNDDRARELPFSAPRCTPSAFADCLRRQNTNVRCMGTLPPAVRSLLIVNAIAFVIGLLLPGVGIRMVEWFAFWFPRNEYFAWWQLVTYMFMHGGIAHIFFNMFALVSFGLLLERQWGSGRFLLFYFLCGIGAAVIHSGINWNEYQGIQNQLVEAGLTAPAIETMLSTGRYVVPRNDPAIDAAIQDLYRIYATPMVGASGAIYGLLVGFGILYPNAKLALLFLPVPIAAKFFVPIILGLDLLSGITGFSLFGGGIAHFAHIGGALIGFLLMWHWRKRPPRTPGLFHGGVV